MILKTQIYVLCFAVFLVGVGCAGESTQPPVLRAKVEGESSIPNQRPLSRDSEDARSMRETKEAEVSFRHSEISVTPGTHVQDDLENKQPPVRGEREGGGEESENPGVLLSQDKVLRTAVCGGLQLSLKDFYARYPGFSSVEIFKSGEKVAALGASNTEFTDQNPGPLNSMVAYTLKYEADTKSLPVNHLYAYQASVVDQGNGSYKDDGPYRTPIEAERKSGVPEGKLSYGQFQSKKNFPGRSFKYQLYVPSQYRVSKPAALMVVQDAEYAPQNLRLREVLDNLIAAKELPVTIGLFVDPSSRDRRAWEYDVIGREYGDFLISEIIPSVVTSKYKIVDDPEGWVIAGHSSGAPAAFTTGWYFPDRFRKILTFNGSFTTIATKALGLSDDASKYPEKIQSNSAKPLRVFLQSGTGDLNNQFGSWLEANQKMAKAFEQKKYAYRFVHGVGDHSFDHARHLFPDAMRWMMRGYELPCYRN